MQRGLNISDINQYVEILNETSFKEHNNLLVGNSFFKAQTAQSDAKFAEVKKFFEGLKFEAESPYKHDVISCQAAVPGTNFRAIKSTVTAKGDIFQFINKEINAPQVAVGQPKYGLTEKIYYYENDDQKKKLVDIKSVDEKLHYVVYFIMEGPMMVADREFLFFKTIHKDGSKVYITSYSAGDDIKGANPKAVRSFSQKLQIFETVGDSVKIVQYSYADPKGNIPASVYNNRLDAQNAMLAAIVRSDK